MVAAWRLFSCNILCLEVPRYVPGALVFVHKLRVGRRVTKSVIAQEMGCSFTVNAGCETGHGKSLLMVINNESTKRVKHGFGGRGFRPES